MIFQSLGSNYSFGDAVKLLFARGSKQDSENLVHLLENHYGGVGILYDKGRNALSAALAGIKASHVAINGTTCSVVVEALEAAHSQVAYLDIEKHGHFSAESLKQAIKDGAKLSAVIVQNTYGQPCDIEAIEQVARANSLILIEDLAHSIGQTYSDGREVGTVGDIIMFSFGRDKIIDVVSGGALVIREPSLLKKIPSPAHMPSRKSQSRDHIYPSLMWMARKLYRVIVGKLIVAAMYKLHLAEHSADGGIDTSHTMSEWQAKRLATKFQELDTNVAHRKEINDIYVKSLNDVVITQNALIRTPIRVDDRAKILQALERNGVYLADTWYDTPVGPKRKFATMTYPAASCPQSVELAKHILNLPTHQAITPQIAKRIASIVKEAL